MKSAADSNSRRRRLVERREKLLKDFVCSHFIYFTLHVDCVLKPTRSCVA